MSSCISSRFSVSNCCRTRSRWQTHDHLIFVVLLRNLRRATNCFLVLRRIFKLTIIFLIKFPGFNFNTLNGGHFKSRNFGFLEWISDERSKESAFLSKWHSSPSSNDENTACDSTFFSRISWRNFTASAWQSEASALRTFESRFRITSSKTAKWSAVTTFQ